jgi:predicted dehydrogenase
MDGDKLKVSVVGVGHLGEHHARILSKMEGVSFMGVYDVDRPRAEEIAAKCRSHAFSSLQSAVKASDAVSLVVPTAFHGELGLKVLEVGRHLFVEKPITRTLEEAERLIEAAASRNLTLQAGHIERFNAGILALSEYLTVPRFVESHRLGPIAPRVKDVGVVLDLMIHDLDLVLSLVKSPVKHMEYFGVPILTDREDIANTRIHFESGCVADLTVSRVTPEPQRKVRIFQDDAYLSLDYLTQTLEIFRRRIDPETNRPTIDREVLTPEKHDALTVELESFLHAIRNGHRPVVTGEDGLEALKLGIRAVEQIEASMKR